MRVINKHNHTPAELTAWKRKNVEYAAHVMAHGGLNYFLNHSLSSAMFRRPKLTSNPNELLLYLSLFSDRLLNHVIFSIDPKIFDPSQRAVYTAILTIYSEKGKPDLISVTKQLSKKMHQPAAYLAGMFSQSDFDYYHMEELEYILINHFKTNQS